MRSILESSIGGKRFEPRSSAVETSKRMGSDVDAVPARSRAFFDHTLGRIKANGMGEMRCELVGGSTWAWNAGNQHLLISLLARKD